MSAEANKVLIRRLFDEVLNGGKMDVIDEIISSEYVEHAALAGQQDSGPKGVEQRLAIFREAFPDLYWDLEDLVTDEENAVARWRMEATNQGEFMGMAPTGKRVTVSGIDIYRVSNGRITEHWHEMDTLSLMQQLGIVT